MYDNLPFYTHDKITIQRFLESGLLVRVNESVDYNKQTGEQYTKSALYEYYNLKIRVKFFENGDYKELRSRGSFHYLKNKGLHNANMVDWYDAIGFLKSFGELFNIDLRTLKLSPPEFAAMINPSFDVEKIIQHTFYEQRKKFIINAPGAPSKISGKVSNDYRLKVYSKYHEFPQYCEPNTFRLEYQAKKMRALHRLDIYTMHDLLSTENWIKIRELHLRYFKHLLVYDYTIKPPRSIRVKRKLQEYNNQIFWENLVKQSKSNENYNTKYNDAIEELNKWSKKYGSNITSEIITMIGKYWDWFLKRPEKHPEVENKKPKHAPYLKPKHAPIIGCEDSNKLHILRTKTKRFCKLTGIDITMQKEKSFLLSHKGLRHLQKVEPKLYDGVMNRYLTPKWQHAPLSVQIREASHNIRNYYFNGIRSQKNRYRSAQYNLLEGFGLGRTSFEKVF